MLASSEAPMASRFTVKPPKSFRMKGFNKVSSMLPELPIDTAVLAAVDKYWNWFKLALTAGMGAGDASPDKADILWRAPSGIDWAA